MSENILKLPVIPLRGLTVLPGTTVHFDISRKSSIKAAETAMLAGKNLFVVTQKNPMAQWASAFAESALGLTKSVGDIAGPCMFAVTMGISRTLYGKYGEKLNLMKFMIGSAMLCLICYITASLSGIPVIGLLGCIMCGFSVGIMWPGSISICSGKIPTGGTAMFALLAMAGDLGGALGPAIVGNVTQNAGNDMQKGMLSGCAFPLILMISLLLLNRARRRNN